MIPQAVQTGPVSLAALIFVSISKQVIAALTACRKGGAADLHRLRFADLRRSAHRRQRESAVASCRQGELNPLLKSATLEMRARRH